MTIKTVRVAAIIPAKDEVGVIESTLHSLAAQELAGEDFRIDLTVLVAENGSSDDTYGVVNRLGAGTKTARIFSERFPTVGMCQVRHHAIRLLGEQSGAPYDYYLSVDADTLFPPNWLRSLVRKARETRAEIVASSGFYPAELWEKCSLLRQRYFSEVGTVFFDSATIERFYSGQSCLFSSSLFDDFGRPVSDCGFIFGGRMYQELGPFAPEYYVGTDAEILAFGWALYFRALLKGYSCALSPSPEYVTSARRLLDEPQALFDSSCYVGNVNDFREQAEDWKYRRLDSMAEKLDFGPLRKYVVKNYILQPCILDPSLVNANSTYFQGIGHGLSNDLTDWSQVHPAPSTGDIFHFASLLADRYSTRVLENVRHMH
jgi:hypothetical protein